MNDDKSHLKTDKPDEPIEPEDLQDSPRESDKNLDGDATEE